MPTNKTKMGEMQNKRTRNSKTWINFDGSYTTEIHGGDVHYEDEFGSYHNINTDLYDEADFDVIDEPVAKEGAARFKQAQEEARKAKQQRVLNRDNHNFQALRVPFDAHIPRNFKRGYTIGKGKDKLTFKPVNASPSKGEVEAGKRNCVQYQDVWNDADVCIEIKPNGVKETITLKTDRAPSSFRFEVKGNIDTLEELKLQDAWLVDANGTERDVSQEIVSENGKQYVELTADVSGLAYPIAIDPTVSIDNGNMYQQYSGGEIYYNSSPTLGYDDGRYYRLVIKEGPMPSLSSGVTISNARLYMTQEYVNDYGSLSARAKRITEPWVEGDTGYLSTVDDGDGYYSIDDAINGEEDWLGVTNIVQSHYDGLPFYGFYINHSGSGAIEFDWNSTRLIFDYNVPPTEPTITSPNGGETWNAEYIITHTASSDDDGDNITYQLQLSADDGSSWSTILSGVTGTSHTYDFSNEPETSVARIRVRAYDGTSYSDWDESNGVFTIQHNQAPDAPSNLSPAGGKPVNRAETIRFDWQHNDPNSNDPQSKTDLKWRYEGQTSWDTITHVSPNQYYDMAAGTLNRGNVEWRVRTYDQEGLVGPYSAIETFFAGDKPSVPTITSHTDGGSASVANPTIQWSSSGQSSYLLKVLQDGTEVYSHSGGTNKAHTIQYDMDNSTDYTIELTITNEDGLESDSDVITITVSYTPPAAAILDVVESGDTGRLILSITNPTPEGTQPSVLHNSVYRREEGGNWIRIETDLPQGESYTDDTVASGKTYEYYVRSRGDNETYTDSDTISGGITLRSIWLHDPSDKESIYQFKTYEPGRSSQLTHGGGTKKFEGRKLPIVEFSGQEESSVSVTLQIFNGEDLQVLQELVARNKTLLYRDHRGRRIFCAIFGVPKTDEFWGETIPLEIIGVDYKEEM